MTVVALQAVNSQQSRAALSLTATEVALPSFVSATISLYLNAPSLDGIYTQMAMISREAVAFMSD